MAGQIDRLQEMIEKLCERSSTTPQHNLPEAFFHAYTDIIEADVDEAIARDLVDRIRLNHGAEGLAEPLLIKARVAQLLEDEISVTGPITTTTDKCRLVALVGPDRRRQNDDDRQAGGKLIGSAKRSGSA